MLTSGRHWHCVFDVEMVVIWRLRVCGADLSLSLTLRQRFELCHVMQQGGERRLPDVVLYLYMFDKAGLRLLMLCCEKMRCNTFYAS